MPDTKKKPAAKKTAANARFGFDPAELIRGEFDWVKKITTKIMVGNAKKVPEGPLYAVIGTANATEEGEGPYGPFQSLKGRFRALSLAGPNEGLKLAAGTVFLPDIAHDSIAAQLNDQTAIDFALIITKIDDDEINIGYRYGLREMKKPAENDPIVAMIEDMTS